MGLILSKSDTDNPMAHYHLTPVSSNKKTGAIPVSTSSTSTCPSACPFKAENGGGCYGLGGPLAIHWSMVSQGKRGGNLDAFLAQIKKLPKGQLWRHNQVGDLPGDDNHIEWSELSKLVAANKGKRGFTYTHKPLTASNLLAIRGANAQGFTVNVSTNGLAHAAQVKTDFPDLPVCVVVESDEKRPHFKVGEHTVVTCPAAIREGIDCASCGLCQRAERPYIIGFPAHGVSKKKVNAIVAA